MGARWYYESAPDVWTEITDRIGRMGWEVREQAEEGSAAMSTLVIDDPDMDFDIVGRVILYCEEDTSEADDDRLFGGIVADQEIGRKGGDWTQPLSRIWTVSVTDLNANWQRRVMVGTDCNRPAETDVERVQWLLTTTETNWATDTTTYVSTAAPVDMDACDYRGQTVAQIMDDAAQASGRNWFTWLLRDSLGDPQIAIWYGRDSLAVYDSPLFLSNDPDDWTDAELEDGTSLVWPISMDTKLRRDPSRVYSGVYLPYSNGAIYRLDQDTIDEFSPWDFIAPSLNVKTKAKAEARATRYLGELDEQNKVITTSVELPAAKGTMIRAGMRVQFRATHLPGYDGSVWCRVLSCSVTPVAAGERYRLALELSPVEPIAPTVKWVYFQPYGNLRSEFELQVSDDGTNWTTVHDGASLTAGTVDPPNSPPGTVQGLVEIPEAEWRHRYWRISHVAYHAGGYYGGIWVTILRLLSGSDWDAVCRLGTLGNEAPINWWSKIIASCGLDGGSPCWTGDIPYLAESNAGGVGGLYGTLTGMCSNDNDKGTSFVGSQGCEYGVGPGVFDAGTFTSTWTFDLLETG